MAPWLSVVRLRLPALLMGVDTLMTLPVLLLAGVPAWLALLGTLAFVVLAVGAGLSRSRFTLSVLDDYHGRIGAASCGKRARPRRPTAKTTALRAIVCEVAAQYLFNVILTPNFNRPHRNHVHLDLTAGKRWFIVR